MLLLLSFKGFSQLSKTHHIPPLTYAANGNANPEDQYIYISTPSNANVPYTIVPVGQPATNYINGTVSNANPDQISIGSGNTQLFIPSIQTSAVVDNKGYIIEAAAPIYVSVRMNAGNNAQAGALVSKGASALDTQFRVGTYTNANPQDNYLNFVSVMATEDNTQVNFSNLPAGLIIRNYAGATPINTTLDEGESYTIALNSFDTLVNRTGLIGCLIQSDKPIVVNCGSANGSFGAGNGRDYGIDQIVGASKVGTEYVFVRGDGSNEWENVLIVAHSDNTSVSVNGNAPIATLNAGEHVVIEGNQFSTSGNMYVETSQPAFAYQGVGGLGNGGTPSEANQGMFFVPPLSCETRGNLNNIANINNIGTRNFDGGITVVTKAGATVTLNGTPIASFNPLGPSPVTGKTDYVTYKVKGLNGNIAVTSTDELYCAYFNYNGAATSGSFYSGFPSPPEIIFDAQFVTLGNCIPNITLEAANTQNFDSYEWLFDDGNGTFNVVASNVPSFTPTVPGKYKLIGIITCTLETLESAEVPISICPDDRDNDGIIDNIDIDNDNDGVLNCVESRGDVVINLSNSVSPELVFQDGTTNSAIVSASFSETNSSGTNTLIGNAIGSFTSNIPATTLGESAYTLNFTEPVNIKVEEDPSVGTTRIADEYFVVRILPVNKNITLVDPDDRLLIDSNFDGLFESGITQMSGSEIHFQFNDTPNGSTPYQFFANQVDGFVFEHHSENTTTDSDITAILSLTCFKKDNDSDGVKDEFDLDSDNDGLPDFVENQGTLTPLSGIDADLNGLDDIYDINVTPIDTDSDGIWGMYDLDSDNDGITDLLETGQLGTLSDTDLDGIEDGPTYGANGWTDAAETTPDSNEIGYNPNDADNDTIFSYIDADSDGDSCSDVTEAGFSDANVDDYLGDDIPVVDTLGKVINAADGYTLPDADYLDGAPINITTQPIDTIVCENSNAVLSVVSPEAETYQWEISTDGINWNPIVNDVTYSGALSADLLISSTPLVFNGYQYRVKLDRNGNTCGLYSDEIDLEVDLQPVANTAPTMRLCDDDNNGTMPFDFTLQNNNITSQPDMSISYHASQADADSNTNPITSPFESSNTTIYARVENTNNTSCFDTSNFELEVYESAFPADASAIAPIQECDNTTVGTDIDGRITFDLTQRETEIFNGQSSSDFSVTYFEDTTYISQIGAPTSFDNTISGGQTIYVRVTNNLFSDCYTDTSFQIEVFELPVVNTPNTYAQCDDDSNDGQALFNLTLDDIKEEINTDHLTEGLVFTYYETQLEAENAKNPIPNPDAYQDATGFTPETIWIRVENPNACFRVVPINLEVNPSSAALASYNPSPKYECDDGTDVRDGVATFDLTDIRDEISNIIFPTINVTVHFYESQIDAELENNEIPDISAHENTNSPNVQAIWVRVKSDLGNDCLGLEEFPNLLNVEALPEAFQVSIGAECDFDTTDAILSFPFDTSQIESDVLNGQSLANVTVSYTYLDQTGTQVTTTNLPDPFLTENQTITVRLTNNNTSDPDGPCFDETTIDFVIYEQPIANTVSPQIVCDGDAGDIDDDGNFEFDTSTFASTILGTQTNMDIFFDYIDENGVTITDAPALPNPLFSVSQTITAEVVNPLDASCSANTTIELTVNPLPDFDINTNERICSSDPTFSIDLTPNEADPTEIFTYEWRWTNSNGTVVDQLITNDRVLTVSTPGTYKITLTKTDGTGCSRSREVLVEGSQSPVLEDTNVRVSNPSYSHTVEIIDLSLLGLDDYEFALQKEGDNTSLSFQSSPVFRNIPPGFYTLYAIDSGQICQPTTLDLAIIGYPQFFTPNGDAYNPYWQIKGISATNQPNSIIQIFDRYGKLIKQLSPSERGWDGTFNGQLMPTDDYWFKVYLQDGRTFMGHFALKR
ncbi:T9SS type B sorting domain-containing protein [Hyunsoonleella sp. SJ7]|uniref:T9SS type B sorting domain-containing protein n=1 Tax=Hyunsoonleella aquatilis TaxID=2762758 RepID=A0A923HFS4_9FLAO|nr:T9SS type B sorting domain-containing protein [Hyunsoonleella aquatilis]MBC3758580.1 T9SS type B sorting domain-containing protein [Hyunsoonleella aquatilis]